MNEIDITYLYLNLLQYSLKIPKLFIDKPRCFETPNHYLSTLLCAVKTIVAEENDFANFLLLLQKQTLDMYISYSQFNVHDINHLCLREKSLNLVSKLFVVVILL